MVKKQKTKQQNWQDIMEQWFDKAPELPQGARNFLVDVAPWFALIFGILGILVGLGGLGLLSILSPMMLIRSGVGNTMWSSASIAASLGSSVLLLIAFPGLKTRKLQGWTMLFWSELAAFVSSLLALSVVGGIIGALIGFYILFQVKSYYK